MRSFTLTLLDSALHSRDNYFSSSVWQCLSGDFGDVLPVARKLLLKGKYDYEIMKTCEESEAEIKVKWRKTRNERRIGPIWILSSCFAFQHHF